MTPAQQAEAVRVMAEVLFAYGADNGAATATLQALLSAGYTITPPPPADIPKPRVGQTLGACAHK